MAQYECSICGYVYDESAEGRLWTDLPDDWVCPVCGAAKSEFQSLGGEPSAAADDAPSQPQQPQEPEEPGESLEPTAEHVQAAAAPAPPPRRATLGHRVFGYVFLAVYVVLLVQMLPRLWTYQIEFPARTVMHISLGMAVGVMLVLKIAIVRFFRLLEQALVPQLGTALLVGSVVLIGISVPSAFQEAAATGRLFTAANRQRVQTLLGQAGLDGAHSVRLASADSLRAGQRILRQQCVRCHDLRTVLARPRTPENWRQTVRRMADRSTLLDPLEENQQWQVTAYLVALSPQLQKSARQLRDQQARRQQSMNAAAASGDATEPAKYDAAAARQLFQEKCSQCHETTLVAESPPGSAQQARELVAAMVEEGLEATPNEIGQIVKYLTDTYAKSPE